MSKNLICTFAFVFVLFLNASCSKFQSLQTKVEPAATPISYTTVLQGSLVLQEPVENLTAQINSPITYKLKAYNTGSLPLENCQVTYSLNGVSVFAPINIPAIVLSGGSSDISVQVTTSSQEGWWEAVFYLVCSGEKVATTTSHLNILSNKVVPILRGSLLSLAPLENANIDTDSSFVFEVTVSNTGTAILDDCYITYSVNGNFVLAPIAVPPGLYPTQTINVSAQGIASSQAGKQTAVFSLICSDVELATLTTHFNIVQPNVAPVFSAEIMSVHVPKSVHTDEVFPVGFVVKNTGNQTWENSPQFHLKAKGYDFGVPGIYRGQGSTVGPGEVFTYGSNLRAPPTAGTFPSQWVLVNGNGYSIGADHDIEISLPTIASTVEVTQGGFTPLPDQNRPGKISWNDFKYVGAFRVPQTVSGLSTGFTQSGLTVYTTSKGVKSLLLNAGYLGNPSLYQIPIPTPVNKDLDGNLISVNALPMAEVSKVWGNSIYETRPSSSPFISGLLYDKGVLYYGNYNPYSYDYTAVLGATQLNEDGSSSPIGNYNIPANSFKAYWGGPLKIGSKFSADHLDGREIGVGFGGYYSICQTTSEGPALAAVARPQKGQTILDPIELINYPFNNGVRAIRPGNYFLNGGIWGANPIDRGTGFFAPGDISNGAVWIEIQDEKGKITKEGVLYISRLLSEWISYHYAAIIPNHGISPYVYLYDPSDLIGVVEHTKGTMDVQPYSIKPLELPYGGQVYGASYDSDTKNLYLHAGEAYQAGVELFGVVYVFHLQ